MSNEGRTAPLVTVVMPAYNAEKTITASIRSVQEQTITDWELLVIDDGSRDCTVAIVGALASEDPRVVLRRNEQNSGTARTRNRALEESRGTYVALLDSDDVWRPDKLEKQIARMKESGADLSYTSYAIVNEAGEKHSEDYLVPETVSYQDLLCQNYLGCSTVMMTRELAKCYRFPTDFYHEDYVMWLQMLRDGKKTVGVTDVLLDYCYRPDSRAGNKFASAKYRWKIYRNYLKLPLFKSAYYLGRYALAGAKKYRRQ